MFDIEKFGFIINIIEEFFTEDDLSKLGNTCKFFSELHHSLWLQCLSRRLEKKIDKIGKRRLIKPRILFFQLFRQRISNFKYIYHHLIITRKKQKFKQQQIRNSNSNNGHCYFDSVATFKKVLLTCDFPNSNNLNNTFCNKNLMIFDGSDILSLLARFQRWKCLKYLIENYNTNIITSHDAQNMTPLCTAAWSGNITMVKFLLESNPQNIKAKDRLDLNRRGTPWQTSSCGSRGPHDALTWAKRKREICGGNYIKIVKLIENYVIDH